jgi:hypothetical protein
MTTENDDQPATTAGACDDETVIVPPATRAAPEHAWSLDDGDNAELRPSWRRAASIAATVVMVSTATAGATLLLGRTNGDAQGGISNATLPTIVTTAPPVITSTVVVTSALAVPPPRPEPPAMRADDQSFFAALAHDGLPPPASIPAAIAMAADVCGAVKHGTAPDEVASWLVPPKGRFTQDQAEAFVADALRTYCPHAGME